MVMAARIVPRPAEFLDPNEQDTLVSVGDLDAEGDGYDVRLEGTSYDITEGDIVSIFGHEETDAKRITFPRVMLLHNTGAFDKVFPGPAALEHGRLIGLDYRHWLSAKVPEQSKLKKIGKTALPTILFGSGASMFSAGLTEKALRGLANKLAPKSLHDNRLPTEKEKFMDDFTNYQYADLTEVYKQVIHLTSAWVLNNPDPEKNFVVKKRGGNSQGLLVE